LSENKLSEIPCLQAPAFVHSFRNLASLVLRAPSDFLTPNIGATVVSADKQLTMPPQKKFKKNTPAVANQEDHHVEEDNGNFLTTEPSQISDQGRRAKLEALQKARGEKTVHTLEAFTEEEADEEDDEVVDKELETVNQKVLKQWRKKDSQISWKQKEEFQRN
jgi:hypothetical protein